MSEPTTGAGRALLRGLGNPDVAPAILAIEREAAEKALHSAAERVRALVNPWDEGSEFVTEFSNGFGFEKGRAAVLAILEASDGR